MFYPISARRYVEREREGKKRVFLIHTDILGREMLETEPEKFVF